ncbi:MAG: hypothetical protein H6839_15820 [Planctomycetes bacterium]|nr:hypothetical protein [Planctomycetota bacterium]
MKTILPLVCLCLLTFACAPATVGNDAPTPPMPTDFAIELAGGGGVTGEWHSISVTAKGDVLEDNKRVATVPQSTREELWKLLIQAGFFDMSGEPGNMSDSITVTANGDTKHVVQELGADPDGFGKLGTDCASLIRQTRKPIQ